jgi:glycosyltransferase involved in cell wall biosynthesis
MANLTSPPSHPRLALYLPNLDGGGAERMMVNLANGFLRWEVKVDLVLAAAQGPYLEEVRADVRIIDLASAGVLASLPKLVHYLRRERPDALLATLNHASVVALLARRLAGVPTRVVNRESNMLFPGAVQSPKRKALREAVRRTYPWADAHIAVSQGVANDLKRFVSLPAERVYTIYNPVVTETLSEKACAPLQHPWFAAGEPPVILGVGRLTPQKDFSTLLRAFAAVRRTRPARLVILGEGGERGTLEELAAELGVAADVELPGFADNPFAYMARASVFVLSSRFEGLPGVLIQAMACGCPVVATNCPSGPSEVLVDGRYGPLTPVGDPAALAAAILKTLADPPPRELLQTRAADFSETATLPRYLEVLLPAHRLADLPPRETTRR